MKIFFTKTVLILIFLSSISCQGNKKPETAESIYLEAFKLLKDKDYTLSIQEFEKIDNEFPYTKWAIKSQTMLVYANYKLKEYEKVIQIAEDFIKLYPSNEYIPYMLYMKGLCYFNKIPSIDRAQDSTKESSLTFRELIARYRDSIYYDDAKEKIRFIDEHIAGSLMSIARYQIFTENYIGAIKHINEAINRYNNSNQTPEAYYRLAEIYFKIGMNEEAQNISKKLNKRFPKNYWSQESKKFLSTKFES